MWQEHDVERHAVKSFSHHQNYKVILPTILAQKYLCFGADCSVQQHAETKEMMICISTFLMYMSSSKAVGRTVLKRHETDKSEELISPNFHCCYINHDRTRVQDRKSHESSLHFRTRSSYRKCGSICIKAHTPPVCDKWLKNTEKATSGRCKSQLCNRIWTFKSNRQIIIHKSPDTAVNFNPSCQIVYTPARSEVYEHWIAYDQEHGTSLALLHYAQMCHSSNVPSILQVICLIFNIASFHILNKYQKPSESNSKGTDDEKKELKIKKTPCMKTICTTTYMPGLSSTESLKIIFPPSWYVSEAHCLWQDNLLLEYIQASSTTIFS